MWMYSPRFAAGALVLLLMACERPHPHVVQTDEAPADSPFYEGPSLDAPEKEKESLARAEALEQEAEAQFARSMGLTRYGRYRYEQWLDDYQAKGDQEVKTSRAAQASATTPYTSKPRYIGRRAIPR